MFNRSKKHKPKNTAINCIKILPHQKKCFPLRKSIYLICNENNTKMEQKTIKIADLEVNRGQIDGLPKNPRTIKDARFEALKKSIEDAPEMLALRELLVYPHNGKFVVIGGNMRLKACKELGYKELPSTKAKYDKMCGLDPTKYYRRSDYIRGGESEGGFYAPIHLFFRQKKSLEINLSRNPIFKD